MAGRLVHVLTLVCSTQAQCSRTLSREARTIIEKVHCGACVDVGIPSHV